jgi:hypothetical protein
MNIYIAPKGGSGRSRTVLPSSRWGWLDGPVAVALPTGPTGRENPAQGRGRRPMPWEKGHPNPCGLKGRESSNDRLRNRRPQTPSPLSRDPSGRTSLSISHPGYRPSASTLGSVLPARWAGLACHVRRVGRVEAPQPPDGESFSDHPACKYLHTSSSSGHHEASSSGPKRSDRLVNIARSSSENRDLIRRTNSKGFFSRRPSQMRAKAPLAGRSGRVWVAGSQGSRFALALGYGSAALRAGLDAFEPYTWTGAALSLDPGSEPAEARGMNLKLT